MLLIPSMQVMSKRIQGAARSRWRGLMCRLSRWGRLATPLRRFLLHSLPWWRNSLNGVAHIAWKQVPGWFHSLDFSGKHPFHFSILFVPFRLVVFFSPLLFAVSALVRLKAVLSKVCIFHECLGTSCHYHVGCLKKPLHWASNTLFLLPLSTCSSCWTTTDVASLGFVAAFAPSALKVYGQIGHWSGTQWVEVKRYSVAVLTWCLLGRREDVCTRHITCNRIRSGVKERHFIHHAIYAT